MAIDLHTHTTHSDGSLTPSELVEFAKNIGLKAIAVTDHDTISGVGEAMQAGERLGVTVIPGVEVSVDTELGSLHLLAYGFDPTNRELSQTLVQLRDSRSVRNERMLAKLAALGYEVTAEEVARFSGIGITGRGHIARALVEHGYFPDVPTTFAQLVGKGKAGYVDRFRLSLKEAVRLIHQAGGVAVWAHPGVHRGTGELDAMLANLGAWADFGLDGLESDYGDHSHEFARYLRGLAVQYSLIVTGGSDFHGDLKPAVKLGLGPEGSPIPYGILSSLEARIALRRNAVYG